MIFKDVRKNKIKTVFFMIGFAIFVALFIWVLGVIFLGDIYVAIVIAAIFSLVMSFASYYNSDQIVLKLNGARPATREEFLQLNESLEGLCIAAGMPMPKLYVMEDTALNAFATGRNPKNAVVCVTTGLLNRLDKYEIEGVLAHELCHIKNYDILLQTIVIITVGMIVIVADIASRSMFRGRSSDNDNKAAGILALVGIIFIVLSPIFAQLIKLAISRNREYLADANAVELTRNKDGLINALKKLTNDTEALEQANVSTASLYIVNPLVKERQKDSLMSTHPNINNRITRLENIQ